MPVRKIKGSWWVDFQFNRQRTRKRSPINTREGARNYESMLRQRVALGQPICEEERQVQTFEQFAWLWLEKYAKSNNKLSGVIGKTSALKTHLIPFFGRMKLDQITSLHIEEYKALKKSQGLCHKTINNHLTVFSTCLTYAVEWEAIGVKPNIKRLKVPKQGFDFLSQEESALLIGLAEGYLKEMLVMALDTGMRYGEIRALSWHNINWDSGQVCVQAAFYRAELGATKSENIRYIKMTPRLRELLENRKKRRGFVFEDNHERFLEENLARRALRKLVESCGLGHSDGRKIGWHAMRHTFASHLAMAGVALPAIQKLLGHSSITTTMRYAHLCPSTLGNAIDVLDESRQIENARQPGVNRGLKIISFQDLVGIQKEANTKQKQALADLFYNGGDGGS